MAEESKGSGTIRFGPFELSFETHELSRDGIRLRLHGQPIQVLELLTACPGRLVTRDELKKKLWPKETFGDFERGLNAAVNRLRDKLGDSAVEPIYVETVPGRGYRFIAKKEEPPEVPDTTPKRGPDKTKRWALVLIVAMAVVAAAILLRVLVPLIVSELRVLLPPILPPRSSVLIADFDSRGDDPLPDAMVREGLTVALQQSQYVNVFSRPQIQEILAQMEKAPGSRIDEATGREICQRANLQVLLTGSIENLGKVFEVTVRAVDPGKGNVFFAEEEHFKKEEFFEKVDALAKRVRRDLGESVKRIKASSLPLAEVTTHDLQALQLYSQAADARDQGRVEQVPALLLAALARDPEFAMAHWLIAEVYETIGNRAQELEHLKHAFEHRDRLTDRESRFIEASYYLATERADEAVNVLTALVALYPQDPEAHRHLAFAYYDLGDLDNSIKQLNEVIKIDPNSALTYGNLVVQLARNNAPEEALNMYQKAHVRGLAPPGAEWGLGMALWNQGRVAEAQAHFQSLEAPGSLYASIGRIYFARTLIYQGKFAAASAQFTAGITEDQAANNKAPELLERYLLAAVALTQGNRAEAQRQLQLILAAGKPSALEAVDLQRAGALYAQMGDLVSARRILRKLEDLITNMPSRSNSAYRDNLAGEIALAGARSTDAERLFSASLAAYPLALSHQGLARAYEAQQDWPMAAKEWEKFLNFSGEVFQDDCPTDLVLAHLFLARVDLHLNDIDGSRAEYKKFLKIWGESDQSGFVQQVVSEARQATN
jgi:DNA-binding winged helix-turn-helix (wHTH) protein/tetratricopeptide (TPR) repeat protein